MGRPLRRFGAILLIPYLFFYPIFAVSAPAGSGGEKFPLDLQNFSLLEKERQMRDELEHKLQKDIVDPILGQGRAMVFVNLQLEVVTAQRKVLQMGAVL